MLYNLRQNYQNILIGEKGKEEKVWIKKLKLILNRDIHGKPLGCKISNTHINVSNIHLGSFYEAQILFSHNYWVNRFSEWLAEKIEKKNFPQDEKIVLIGYETYFEPVLYALRKTLSVQYASVDYLIYEEEKFIQSNRLSDKRIRYVDDWKKNIEINKTNFVFICGIASTLTTFGKMKSSLRGYLSKIDDAYKRIEDCSDYFSIVQVLPESEDNRFNFEDNAVLTWREDETNKANRETDKETIKTEFLVGVHCEWQQPKNCKWCFPIDSQNKSVPLQERPIIAVSDTSLIPLQMLDSTEPSGLYHMSPQKIDFFKRDAHGNFVFKDFLYYNHTVRDEHHFQYYIRTGHLFMEILKNHEAQFREICDQIKQKTMGDVSPKVKQVNVIVSPRHFSDGMFAQAINEYVFNNKAHMISLDVKKEFRQNFKTKYSNFSYFLEQVDSLYSEDQHVNLNFYFVDDQIISGGTFYRIKSFISSLMKNKVKPNLNIFAGVIVLVNRLSESSKYNFVDEPSDKFFSIIDIAISSVRNYGDACPGCKFCDDALTYQKRSALDKAAYYWASKQFHYGKRNLTEARDQKLKLSNNFGEKILDRHFRRFYCENLLWQGCETQDDQEKISLRECCNEKDYSDYFLRIIVRTLSDFNVTTNDRFEYLLSFIKAISRPFIYYKENAKKASLRFLLTLAEQLKGMQDRDSLQLSYKKKKISVKLNIVEKYTLITVLINSLAAIDSTYLLNVERIIEWYNKVVTWNSNLCEFGEENRQYIKWTLKGTSYTVERFYSVVLNAYKRVICGISGDAKCKKFHDDFWKFVSNNRFYKHSNRIIDSNPDFIELKAEDWYNLKLFRAMFLEGAEERIDLGDCENDMTLNKYCSIADNLKDVDAEAISKVKFYYFTQERNDSSQSEYVNQQQVFEIDEFVNNVDIAKILSQESVRSVKSSLNSLGYCQNGDQKNGKTIGNRWLFKMSHYNADDFSLDNNGQQKLNTNQGVPADVSVCLYVELNDDLTLGSQKLEVLRKILGYRYILTKQIRKDLESGAIEAAIKAEGAKKLLSSDKLFGHGQIKDIDTLYDLSEKLLRTEQDKTIPFRIISLFMDRCIGFGGTRELLMEYFTAETRHKDITKPFRSTVTGNVHSKDYIIEYLDFLKDEKNCQNLFEESFIVVNEYESGQSETDIRNAVRNNLPFFYTPQKQSIEDDTPYQIVLIGLIDVLIRNACKHGAVSKTNPIRVKWSLIKENNDECYRITVVNRLKESNPLLQQKQVEQYNWNTDKEDDEVDEETNVRFTTLFFDDYLKRNGAVRRDWKLESEPYNNAERESIDKEEFRATITVKIINKGE